MDGSQCQFRYRTSAVPGMSSEVRRATSSGERPTVDGEIHWRDRRRPPEAQFRWFMYNKNKQGSIWKSSANTRHAKYPLCFFMRASQRRSAYEIEWNGRNKTFDRYASSWRGTKIEHLAIDLFSIALSQRHTAPSESRCSSHRHQRLNIMVPLPRWGAA